MMLKNPVVIFLLSITLTMCNKVDDGLEKKYMEGLAYYHKKDLKQSMKLFSEVYSQDTHYKEVGLYIGKIYFFTGKFKDAEEFFERASSADDSNINAKIWLVKVISTYAKDNDSYKKAIYYAEEILEKDSSNLELLFILGKLYYKSGNLEKAIAVYKKIISFSDEIALAHLELGKLYKNSGIQPESKKHIHMANKIASNHKMINNEIKIITGDKESDE